MNGGGPLPPLNRGCVNGRKSNGRQPAARSEKKSEARRRSRRSARKQTTRASKQARPRRGRPSPTGAAAAAPGSLGIRAPSSGAARRAAAGGGGETMEPGAGKERRRRRRDERVPQWGAQETRELIAARGRWSRSPPPRPPRAAAPRRCGRRCPRASVSAATAALPSNASASGRTSSTDTRCPPFCCCSLLPPLLCFASRMVSS